MSVSRFFGATTREALRQVRLALGPEAMIVSNRRVSGGVEILATDPTQAESVSAPVSVVPDEGMVARQPAPVAPPAAGSDGVARQSDLQQAVGDIRGLFEARMDELLWGHQLQRAPAVLPVFQRLLGMGFSTKLLRAMLKHLPGQLSERAALEWCRNELVKHLPVDGEEERALTAGAIVALVGPTGVGKTTTIAKLAARCVRRLGAGNVVLLTTDTYRIGAHEQLRIYGRLMGVPVHVAEGKEQLAALVREAGPDKLVLIDNIGVSQRDHYVGEQAAMLAAASPRVIRLLALNAASHGDTLDEVAKRYVNDGGPRLVGCLITKVDEAGRLAPVLDTCIRYRLPIHYVSIGQKVPEDLVRADAAQLVDQAMGAATDAPALYAPSQADLAMLMAAQEAAAPKKAEAQQAQLRLENILSLLSGRSGGVAVPELEQACRLVDDHLATSLAYEGFLRWQSEQEPISTGTVLSRVERTLPLLGGERAVVMSGQFRLPQTAGRQAVRACLLATQDGQWLATPWQCWMREDGWLSNDGKMGSQAPMPELVDALQAEALGQGRLPRVQVLEDRSGGPAPTNDWLAVCAPRSRWTFEGEPGLAVAISRQLVHQPLTLALDAFTLDSLGWSGESDISWWVAQTEVDAARRHGTDQPLAFFSLKAMRQSDGKVLKHWLAVGQLQAADLAPMHWAQWLVLHAVRQAVLRVAGHHWQWLSLRPGKLPSVHQAGLAVQLALATVQMLGHPAMSKVLHELVEEGKPNAARLARASCKLFELKRMLPTAPEQTA